MIIVLFNEIIRCCLLFVLLYNFFTLAAATTTATATAIVATATDIPILPANQYIWRFAWLLALRAANFLVLFIAHLTQAEGAVTIAIA